MSDLAFNIDWQAIFGSVVKNVIASINGVLPIAAVVFGMMVAVGLGIKLFKKLTGRV